MAAVCDDTVEDVDAALLLLSFDQRRVSDTDRWWTWVDRLLDQRAELTAERP